MWEEGVGAGWWDPVALRFLGEVVYSERRWEPGGCVFGDVCVLLLDGVPCSLSLDFA